ncbi:MAG: nicotinate-nucleotide adenylyltransferase [Lachnospiraceae bacterium]|nr:nicotinate-nucleotide adenylyltransferase [Lachnospiraceae bacterium]
MRKIGILGGTFDPIHNGHVMLAAEAYSYLMLDEIILMPSGFSYMKGEIDISKPKYRLDMAELAVKDYPYITVSDLEIRRAGATYTCDTIVLLKEIYEDTELFFIVGADTLYNMEKWKEPDYIFKNLTIAVRVRDDIDKAELEKQIILLKDKYGAKILFLAGEKIEISSHVIRDKIKKDEDVSRLLSNDVAEYIAINNLYRGG